MDQTDDLTSRVDTTVLNHFFGLPLLCIIACTDSFYQHGGSQLSSSTLNMRTPSPPEESAVSGSPLSMSSNLTAAEAMPKQQPLVNSRRGCYSAMQECGSLPFWDAGGGGKEAR